MWRVHVTLAVVSIAGGVLILKYFEMKKESEHKAKINSYCARMEQEAEYERNMEPDALRRYKAEHNL